MKHRHRRRAWLAALLCAAVLSLPACTYFGATFGAPALRDARIEALSLDERTSDIYGPIYVSRLLVRFSTNRALSDYRREHGSSIYVDATLCHDGQADPLRHVGISGILEETDEPIITYGRPQAPDAGSRYLYRFYLSLTTRTRDWGFGHFSVAHDYRRDGDDICFYFRGVGTFGGTHRSPDFRIPYALIANALARAGMPHAAPRAPLTPGS
jgi:hypothetical protein